jgi:hypothetical protein
MLHRTFMEKFLNRKCRDNLAYDLEHLKDTKIILTLHYFICDAQHIQNIINMNLYLKLNFQVRKTWNYKFWMR